MKKLLFVVVASALTLSSCISKKDHEALQNKQKQTQQELLASKSAYEISDTERKSLGIQNKSLLERIALLEKNNTHYSDQMDKMSLLAQITSENLGKTLNKIDENEAKIDALNSSIAKKDSLNQILVANLKGSLSDINDDDLNIQVEKGVVFVSISDKLLFSSGKYDVSKKAISVLGTVARVLNNNPDFEIMVEGHTDDKSVISNDKISDNWDLSVRRATAVVRILTDKYEVDAQRVSAAGRAQYKPIYSNETNEGRAKNRRTKIILLPKTQDFLELWKKK
ncbi:MAG: OmpA family protein [Flavobacteriaceae bacterium]|nr:OmpA family protein [Flavobacteriaceae bacterium]